MLSCHLKQYRKEEREEKTQPNKKTHLQTKSTQPSFPPTFLPPLLRVQPDLTTLINIWILWRSTRQRNFCLVAECLSADQLHTKAREGVDSNKFVCFFHLVEEKRMCKQMAEDCWEGFATTTACLWVCYLYLVHFPIWGMSEGSRGRVFWFWKISEDLQVFSHFIFLLKELSTSVSCSYPFPCAVLTFVYPWINGLCWVLIHCNWGDRN